MLARNGRQRRSILFELKRLKKDGGSVLFFLMPKQTQKS